MIKNKITEDILKGDFGGLKYIYGEAGTGKTRLIEEIISSLDGKNVKIMYFVCNNDIQTKKKILSFLYDKKLISKKEYSKELRSFFSGLKYASKKHLIILDDIHNLNTLLDELKQLNFARFYTNHKFEIEFYNKFSCITFLNRNTNFEIYNTIRKKSILHSEGDRLKDEYQRVQKDKLLYMDENIIYKVLDIDTGYFIVFA